MKKYKGKAIIAGLLIASLLGAYGTNPVDSSQDADRSGQGTESLPFQDAGESGNPDAPPLLLIGRRHTWQKENMERQADTPS